MLTIPFMCYLYYVVVLFDNVSCDIINVEESVYTNTYSKSSLSQNC